MARSLIRTALGEAELRELKIVSGRGQILSANGNSHLHVAFPLSEKVDDPGEANMVNGEIAAIAARAR